MHMIRKKLTHPGLRVRVTSFVRNVAAEGSTGMRGRWAERARVRPYKNRTPSHKDPSPQAPSSDEFMDAMGMCSAALGYDRVSCHSSETSTSQEVGHNSRNRKGTWDDCDDERPESHVLRWPATVSCCTCHRGKSAPDTAPSLALQYGKLTDDPNAMVISF